MTELVKARLLMLPSVWPSLHGLRKAAICAHESDRALLPQRPIAATGPQALRWWQSSRCEDSARVQRAERTAHDAGHGGGCAAERGATGRSATRSTRHRLRTGTGGAPREVRGHRAARQRLGVRWSSTAFRGMRRHDFAFTEREVTGQGVHPAWFGGGARMRSHCCGERLPGSDARVDTEATLALMTGRRFPTAARPSSAPGTTCRSGAATPARTANAVFQFPASNPPRTKQSNEIL